MFKKDRGTFADIVRGFAQPPKPEHKTRKRVIATAVAGAVIFGAATVFGKPKQTQ